MPAHPHASGSADAGHMPLLIAWEVTRRCMLACKHCRAAAQPTPYPDELSTEECFKLLDNIASFSKPIMILTGGEPMLRPDIHEIAAHSTSLGLRTVMATCGTMLNDESTARILASGIGHISISLDGATAEAHDTFRGVEGAFDSSLRGIEAAKRGGLEFQINTTVTRHNMDELPAILDMAVRLGATVFNPFLLVPTGRGKQLADQEISPTDYEKTLHYLALQQGRKDIGIRVTCAPHYQRVLRQSGLYKPGGHVVKGCMGGQSFAFISHRGKVQICGFLDKECGDVRGENYDFRKIWETSEVFLQMRNPDGYHGRCGYCEFRQVCGGCRARAHAITGDYLAEEPFCTYEPKQANAKPSQSPVAELSDLDKSILSIIQTDFPVTAKPYDVLAERLGANAEKILSRVATMMDSGAIRRLGPIFDSRSLGYASTLVAAKIPPQRTGEVARIVSALPSVTHNYQRDNTYNLWFTLTAESERRIEDILDTLRQKTGIADFHSMPAITVYKIRVDFQFDNSSSSSSPNTPRLRREDGPIVPLTEPQKQLVRLLQESLPVTDHPFDKVARQVDCPTEKVLAQINDWMARGVIRRMGAVVRHHRLGFTANGMGVFQVDDDSVDQAGRELAKCPDVSHCYRRPMLEDFPYTLFAMFHGQSENSVRSAVKTQADRLGLTDYDILFSTVQHKKTSMRYFIAEIDEVQIP